MSKKSKTKNTKKIEIVKPIAGLVKAVFGFIFKFIDKRIINPLSKLVLLIVNRNSSGSKKLEKIFSNNNALIFLSLVLALIAFFVIDTRANNFLESSAEVLYNQPVDAIYNEEKYVIEGLPETVDITLIGRSSDLYLAKQLPTHEVTLDLVGLTEGMHKVQIKYTQSVNSINYKLDPSTATIIIYPKVSETKTLKTDVLNQDELDPKLVIENISIDRDDVIIKGAEHTLKEVANVKALIDINNLVDPEEGEITLKSIPLIAYNETGDVVEVELVPSKVDAVITIASPQKTVPIKVTPVGELASGKAIKEIELSESTIVIYGEQTLIDEINYVPIEIDIDGLSSDKEYNVTIEKPVGVNETSISNVTVDVSLDEEITKEYEDIIVTPENLGDGLKVTALSEEDAFITVAVKGTESSLENFDVSTISAYIDLDGFGVGEFDVDVIVEGDDETLVYTPKVKKVSIKISK